MKGSIFLLILAYLHSVLSYNNVHEYAWSLSNKLINKLSQYILSCCSLRLVSKIMVRIYMEKKLNLFIDLFVVVVVELSLVRTMVSE